MSLYQNLYQSLEPLLGAKTQSILEEGVRRLGVDPDRLDVGQAESILKRLVYRELQANRTPAEARGLVDGLLKELREQAGAEVGGGLAALESGFKRFSLYLDWPEVARLRGILSVLRKEPEGAEASRMLREGQELLQQLEERLQSALLRQTRDIADLQAVFERVKMIGGPKIRRLESLIRQIQEAHSGETLAQAEVERARTLAAELRKLVESSAISAPRNATEPALFVEDEDEPVVAAEPLVETDAPEAAPATGEAWDIVIDLDSLSQEQQTRIREIDLAEDRRRLETLKERYAAVLARAGVAEELARLEGELAQGNLLGEALGAFEERLKAAQAEALSEARARYEWLSDRMRQLSAPEHRDDVDTAKLAALAARLTVAWETLQGGAVPQDLLELAEDLQALEAETRSRREGRERLARLAQALEALRAEAESALATYRDHPQVQAYLARLAEGQPEEAGLQTLRQDFSALMVALTKEQKERDESLKRSSLKAAAQALPAVAGLEVHHAQLLQQIETPGNDLVALENYLHQLTQRTRDLVAQRLEALAQKAQEAGVELAGLSDARAALAEGRIPDPAALERQLEERLNEQANQRRRQLAGELSRYEAAAQGLRGLGEDRLMSLVADARNRLALGEIPDTAPIKAELARLVQVQDNLRAEVAVSLAQLLERFNAHRAMGGETVIRLKPMIEFLTSAVERLGRVGPSGILEVRQAIAEAMPLVDQLEQEHKAAMALMQDLKGGELDALLGIFDAQPQAAPSAPAGTPAPAPVPATATLEAEPAEEAPAGESDDALAPFRLRGVEAVALVGENGVLMGKLPTAARSVRNAFSDLSLLAGELAGATTRLAVISLPHNVMIMVPLGEKGLFILAEKPLLSRLLTQVERHRAELAQL